MFSADDFWNDVIVSLNAINPSFQPKRIHLSPNIQNPGTAPTAIFQGYLNLFSFQQYDSLNVLGDEVIAVKAKFSTSVFIEGRTRKQTQYRLSNVETYFVKKTVKRAAIEQSG